MVVLCVVLLVGSFALVGLAGTIWLIDRDRAAESVAIISGLTGTALGALAALLVSTRSSAEPSQPVVVTNTAAEPVPTVEGETP